MVITRSVCSFWSVLLGAKVCFVMLFCTFRGQVRTASRSAKHISRGTSTARFHTLLAVVLQPLVKASVIRPNGICVALPSTTSALTTYASVCGGGGIAFHPIHSFGRFPEDHLSDSGVGSSNFYMRHCNDFGPVRLHSVVLHSQY